MCCTLLALGCRRFFLLAFFWLVPASFPELEPDLELKDLV